ncbi:3816_t:CDS:1, partial [Funneliformis geosporum]
AFIKEVPIQLLDKDTESHSHQVVVNIKNCKKLAATCEDQTHPHQVVVNDCAR